LESREKGRGEEYLTEVSWIFMICGFFPEEEEIASESKRGPSFW
jgi:hypothetical protein